VTAFLSAVFGPRVVLSVVPLTEIEYIAFMIFAMLFYMRWIRSAKFSALLASSVFAALGTTVRYEAWIFVFVFLLLLFIEPESRKTLFAKRQLLPIVFLLTCSFPAYWIISSFRENQALLIFVSSHSDRYSVVDPKTILKGIWHNPVTQFIVQNTFSLNVAGMLPAVALFKKDKQLRRFLLLPAISFILFGGIGLTGSELGTHNPWRIAVLWSCLLIPFTAVWVVEQQERFWQYGRTTAVVFVMMFFFLGQLGWLTQKACFTRPRYEAGIFLRDRVRSALGPDEKILIDTRTWDYVDLLVVSNEPERFVLNGGPSPHKQENLVLSPSIPVDLKILAANPYRYLVFETPLLLNAQSAARCEKIFSNEEWTIYKIISHSAE
jgi:isoprenylcysteine carboxyl methyltransferase (ICMT) family protein YpbQ